MVDDVAEVQPFWAALPLAERARYMRRAAQVVIDSLDELSELLTREQGKPRNESYVMELLPTIDALHWIAHQGPKILSDERVSLPIFLKQKRAKFAYEPLGVVGVIAPWNYPWSIPFGEVAIALMAGNGVVLKPASLTPLIGQRIQETFERAGLPEGLVRAVHGGGAVGQALVESSAAKIFFTGSVEVGRRVGVGCAERMKGSVLELGGKDAMLVLVRRQPRQRGVRRAVGRLRQRGPDLLGHRARVRDARRGGPLRRGPGGGRQGAAGGRSDGVGHRDRPDGLRRAARARARAGGRRGARRGATLHCGGPVEPDGAPRATTTRPPCSPA